MKTKQANATLYPDKIIIATEDKTVIGYSIVSPMLTNLQNDASADNIGENVKKHLALSKIDTPPPANFKVQYQEFLNAAGFKNAKAHHKGARHVSIYQQDQEIIITSTINGGATGKERGFLGSKDMQPIIVSASKSDKELGEHIKEAWLKCVDNSV